MTKSNNQSGNYNNKDNNNVVSKDGIKKISSDSSNVYILKGDGTLYLIDSFSPVNAKEMVKNVENFEIVEEGLFFTTKDKKSYIYNGDIILDPQTNEMIPEKNLETSEGTAVLIDLQNIKSVVDYKLDNFDDGKLPMLFLTEDGNVYTYTINSTTGEQKSEKIMENVKELTGDFYNTILVDNNNVSYVYGFNKIPNGILGTSDFSYGSSGNNYVSLTNKYQLGTNLKDVVVNSNSQHIEVYTIDNNKNLSVIGMGLTYDYKQNTTEFIDRIDTPLTFDTDVENVYANIGEIYTKKTDGSLWHRSFSYGSKDLKKIVDNNVKNVYLDSDYDDGAFILMNNNDLYAYGENPFLKFGVGESVEKYDEPTKIYENVSDVYFVQTLESSATMIVTKNNEIFYSGNLFNVSKWTKLEI